MLIIKGYKRYLVSQTQSVYNNTYHLQQINLIRLLLSTQVKQWVYFMREKFHKVFAVCENAYSYQPTCIWCWSGSPHTAAWYNARNLCLMTEILLTIVYMGGNRKMAVENTRSCRETMPITRSKQLVEPL